MLLESFRATNVTISPARAGTSGGSKNFSFGNPTRTICEVPGEDKGGLLEYGVGVLVVEVERVVGAEVTEAVEVTGAAEFDVLEVTGAARDDEVTVGLYKVSKRKSRLVVREAYSQAVQSDSIRVIARKITCWSMTPLRLVFGPGSGFVADSRECRRKCGKVENERDSRINRLSFYVSRV